MADAAGRLTKLAEEVLGARLPVRIRAWDRSEAGPPGAPVLVFRNRRALRRLLFKPGELGLARGWVAGDLDIEGDLYEALDLLAGMIWERPEPAAPPRRAAVLRSLARPEIRAAAREILSLVGLPLPPAPPAEEARPRRGPLHTLRFYELVLGPSMVYSCAYWESPQATLEEAQHDKLDLICRKLGLKEGQRLLDVGCGWGSMVLHAARTYGVRAVGITLSEEQAAYARKRVADAGLTDRIEIRVQDYREIRDDPFDAVSSIGMAEHVGRDRYAEYASALYALLRPGGRLLNHQIARRPLADEETYRVDEFIDRYVFPDGELSPVGRTTGALEDAGFEVRDVEALREHYALTLRQWVANLERHWDRAARLASPGRARVWRLYMAASALSFERNRIGVNQVLAVRTPQAGESGMPLRARDWRA